MAAAACAADMSVTTLCTEVCESRRSDAGVSSLSVNAAKASNTGLRRSFRSPVGSMTVSDMSGSEGIMLTCVGLAVYLHLLEEKHDPNTIILAGDSAGGGMVLSMLVTLRDQGIPLPAGAILISPWVDLTHSFPSLGGDGKMDYIPAHGFVHKPSMSWRMHLLFSYLFTALTKLSTAQR
ncbi:MAG: steryl acetyl hydrolase [Methanosarcinales archaeon]|nr:MAG: steryl acetyl hydrolase [Methanosarcinales archaeon]